MAVMGMAEDAGAAQHRGARLRSMRMTATAYCQAGKTRSGVHTRDGIVAADPRWLPLGTRLRIVAPGEPYNGTYVVADTGAEISGRDLDIFIPSCARARRFGRKTVIVRILKWGTGPKDARAQIGRPPD
jgi:3D (Asp-Asp-Asp) domain-containing protein